MSCVDITKYIDLVSQTCKDCVPGFICDGTRVLRCGNLNVPFPNAGVDYLCEAGVKMFCAKSINGVTEKDSDKYVVQEQNNFQPTL